MIVSHLWGKMKKSLQNLGEVLEKLVFLTVEFWRIQNFGRNLEEIWLKSNEKAMTSAEIWKIFGAKPQNSFGVAYRGLGLQDMLQSMLLRSRGSLLCSV